MVTFLLQERAKTLQFLQLGLGFLVLQREMLVYWVGRSEGHQEVPWLLTSDV